MVIFQFAMLVYKRVNTSNLQPIHFRHGWRVPSGQKHNRRRRSHFNPANWTCGALYFAVPRCLDADRCQQISMISWLCLTDGSLWMFCWTLFSWYSEHKNIPNLCQHCTWTINLPWFTPCVKPKIRSWTSWNSSYSYHVSSSFLHHWNSCGGPGPGPAQACFTSLLVGLELAWTLAGRFFF